mmetsp:Transcript_144468/g.266445  ORF Transcript_144468/g.266445 Transcript_144468/m.266445 type:complete len:424 (-) Transcript_144468:81-1352(-)
MHVPKVVARALFLGFVFLVVQALISSVPLWAGSSHDTITMSQEELTAVLRKHELKIELLESQLKSAEALQGAIPKQTSQSVGMSINTGGRQLEHEDAPEAVAGWEDNKTLLICLGIGFMVMWIVQKVAFNWYIKLVLKPPHAELTTHWRTIEAMLDTGTSALSTFFFLVLFGPLGATLISFFYSLMVKIVYLYGVKKLESFLDDGLPPEEDSQHYRNKYGVPGVNGYIERWQRDLAREMISTRRITVETKFQEMDRSMVQVLLLFAVQVMLICFLLYALVDEDQPLNWHDSCQLKFYLCSLPVVLVARYGDIQRRFEDEVPVWGIMIFSSHQESQVTNENTGRTFELIPDLVGVRLVISWFVNSVVHELVMRCTPLVLMKAGSYLDFLKDTFAIIFIACLDDADDTPYQISELPEEVEWSGES